MNQTLDKYLKNPLPTKRIKKKHSLGLATEITVLFRFSGKFHFQSFIKPKASQIDGTTNFCDLVSADHSNHCGIGFWFLTNRMHFINGKYFNKIMVQKTTSINTVFHNELSKNKKGLKNKLNDNIQM